MDYRGYNPNLSPQERARALIAQQRAQIEALEQQYAAQPQQAAPTIGMPGTAGQYPTEHPGYGMGPTEDPGIDNGPYPTGPTEIAPPLVNYTEDYYRADPGIDNGPYPTGPTEADPGYPQMDSGPQRPELWYRPREADYPEPVYSETPLEPHAPMPEMRPMPPEPPRPPPMPPEPPPAHVPGIAGLTPRPQPQDQPQYAKGGRIPSSFGARPAMQARPAPAPAAPQRRGMGIATRGGGKGTMR